MTSFSSSHGLEIGSGKLPFDSAKLDSLMEAQGIDVLLVTTKHAIEYLTGGYRYYFFAFVDAIGHSRYLPVLIYVRGKPELSAYIAHRHEMDAIRAHAVERGGFWIATIKPGTSETLDAIKLAIGHLKHVGMEQVRIGVEYSFIPADAKDLLAASLPGCDIVNATGVLERLRIIKTPEELERLRVASDRVVEAMVSVMETHGVGTTKRQLVEAMRREETERGLNFEYCFVTFGRSLDRAPSDTAWKAGDIISLDSGGTYEGYVGDLCRMGILGEPDAQLEELLAEVESVQQAARRMLRPGVIGGDVYSAGEKAMMASSQARNMSFIAHGMGIVSHEPPRVTARLPYPADDIDLPLEAGMVLSVETTLEHPQRGFIKLEDTVAVTSDGPVGFGDFGRGWTRCGTRL